MKILLNFILILYLNFSYSQTKIDSLIINSQTKAELIFTELLNKKELIKNFKFNPENTIIESNNLPSRINFSHPTRNKLIHHWISYDIMSNELILTKIDLPFDNKGNLIYSKNGMKEILKPYIKVLENRTKINLEKAIQIAKNNGLTIVYVWDIDYEKRKLVWTLKSKLDNIQTEVIKINSKNGKILANFIVISIH